MLKKVIFACLLASAVFLLTGAKKIHTWLNGSDHLYRHDVSMCGVYAPESTADKNGKFIPVLPSLGHHHYQIYTRSDSTQIYFDQGLSLYYSFHLNEALASFKEAARFDDNCTMAYWGQALALGPYYNNYNYKMSSQVSAVLMSLQRTNTGSSTKENDLANAMMQRYSSDATNADRKQLDERYADAMHKLAVKYPADNDIKALYIDAVMLCHKWDFWSPDGTPKPWTPEVVALCEDILKADSRHPAALHYYIHLTEASRHPEKALPYADILKDEMPGVGHMVHMATHSYQRNGLFAKGVVVNENSNTAYNTLDSIAPQLHLGKNNVIHIYTVQAYCAMNAGMFSKGMPVYLRARKRLMAQAPVFKKSAYSQFVYMIPEIAYARLGKWQEILKEPRPDTQWRFAVILDNFAKGLAYVHNKDITNARQCLNELRSNLSDSLLAVRVMPYNKPQQAGQIAADILSGEILYAEGKTDEAINALKEAVGEEEKLIYREPQEWFIPARQYLGYYLLKSKKAAEAEQAYKDDLVANPGNGWSLLGMYNCMKAQDKLSEAAAYKLRYEKAFEDADIKPVNSVY
jgi:tetratricopeptide (TPR) repeat protein